MPKLSSFLIIQKKLFYFPINDGLKAFKGVKILRKFYFPNIFRRPRRRPFSYYGGMGSSGTSAAFVPSTSRRGWLCGLLRCRRLKSVCFSLYGKKFRENSCLYCFYRKVQENKKSFCCAIFFKFLSLKLCNFFLKQLKQQFRNFFAYIGILLKFFCHFYSK